MHGVVKHIRHRMGRDQSVAATDCERLDLCPGAGNEISEPTAMPHACTCVYFPPRGRLAMKDRHRASAIRGVSEVITAKSVVAIGEEELGLTCWRSVKARRPHRSDHGRMAI
jgi:hypothetical protein